MNGVTDRIATVWTDGDRPLRMFWQDRRWRVSDTPTGIYGESDFVHPLLTHAPVARIGWRFQVTDDAGESVVVDAIQNNGEWVIAKTYS
ncbi:hypothetical protein ACLRGF_12985 [Mycetocola zhadangensis]|jgi:predicted thioredoxin/glutaredoxin|uniref:hypothetical protein n=1 Tax=Mycetocola zhadangensis TaxID=1164595 RepID=UPI003A4D6949